LNRIGGGTAEVEEEGAGGCAAALAFDFVGEDWGIFTAPFLLLPLASRRSPLEGEVFFPLLDVFFIL
jgi:hypothetical protein